jgi:type IV pilus assembly protein PilV
MLLEALIGIMIFSLGVLALIAMQSVSVSNVSNAKYRVEAAFYADEIISRMWLDSNVGGGPPAPLPLSNINTFAVPGGTNLQMFAWVTKVQSPQGLPGAMTYPPTISIRDVAGPTPTKEVTVTVRWKAPDALTSSNHIAIAYISDP